MVENRERLSIKQEALPGYVTRLAIKLKSLENAFVPDSVYEVLDQISAPNLPFSELDIAQQAVVIKFLEEVLPQVDVSEYEALMAQSAT